jgi:carbonyl reductase 1/carbonyl reductase 3
MTSNRKILLVTGSNKGIGYGIIETLLEKKSNLRIILSSRNEELGKKSFNRLLAKYPYSKDYFYYHQLDITKKESILDLISWIKKEFGKIDYLVNNAGLGTHGVTTDLNLHKAVININAFGTINFTEEMLKNGMINKSGKIILLGSMMGNLGFLKSQELKSKFKNAKTYQELLNLAESFIKSYENNSVEKDGWCKNSYSVSKMVVNSYARVLSYRDEIEKNDISVFAAHPGWVKTDMTGPEAPLTIKEGAVNEVFLIELPDGINRKYQGKYFDSCKVGSFE